MTAPEETSETRKQEATTAPSSGKVKVVALLVGAPSVALLFLILYSAIYNDAFHVVAGTAFFGVPALFPLYYAVKIWKGHTLKNLRCVPFIAAFWSSIGGLFISLLSRPTDTVLNEVRDRGILNLLLMIFALVAYFVVKKVMVSWLEMPELKHSGLSIARKRVLWVLYCFFLWSALISLIEAFSYDESKPVWFLVSIALAVICYYVGHRALNLNQK